MLYAGTKEIHVARQAQAGNKSNKAVCLWPQGQVVRIYASGGRVAQEAPIAVLELVATEYRLLGYTVRVM